MKPLPKAWTQGPDRLLTVTGHFLRPWWSQSLPMGTLQRRDGLRVSRRYGHGGWYLARSSADMSPAPIPSNTAEEAIAHVDKAHPLPFPGIRVGQIWALALPDGTPRPPFLIGSGPNGLPTAGPAPLDRQDHYHPYLLHDPLRPDLAPWSAPEPDEGAS